MKTEKNNIADNVLLAIEKDAIAIFEDSKNNSRFFLIKNKKGKMYGYLLYNDFMEMVDLNQTFLEYVQNAMSVVKSPHSVYHMWHICLCSRCINYGGRIFSHSQGDWDSHLRFIDNNKVFDFHAVEQP